MNSGVIRVAVVSHQEIVRTGIEAMLGRHPERVAVVAIDAVGVADPDVVLYDALGLHDGDGADLAHLVSGLASAVLVVARDLRPDLASRALSMGADGFFSLGVDDKELLAAVESASAGDPGPAVGSSEEAAVEARLGHDAGLTGREVDVLTMIAQGYSNQQIAEQSYLSINSVKTYIRSAYRRIGVTNRSQAVVWALQHGFTTEVSERDA